MSVVHDGRKMNASCLMVTFYRPFQNDFRSRLNPRPQRLSMVSTGPVRRVPKGLLCSAHVWSVVSGYRGLFRADGDMGWIHRDTGFGAVVVVCVGLDAIRFPGS